MKLAKKMLASVLALAMVAALALTAFAAAPEITMNSASVTVGDTVTVTVAGKDIAGLKSADLLFNYDAEVLEFVSVKKAYDDFDIATGGQPEGTTEVRFSFAYMEAAEADNAFCTITFKALKAGTAEVTVSTVSWDGIDAPKTAPATIVVSEPTTPAPATTTEAPVATTAAPTEATSAVETTKGTEIPKTGEAGVAAIAGVMALAAVAFVATRKKDEE